MKKRLREKRIDSLNVQPHYKAVLHFVHLAKNRGATCNEIEDGIQMVHQTVSPAVMRLREMGYLQPAFNGPFLETRLTPRNKPAQVYVLSESLL